MKGTWQSWPYPSGLLHCYCGIGLSQYLWSSLAEYGYIYHLKSTKAFNITTEKQKHDQTIWTLIGYTSGQNVLIDHPDCNSRDTVLHVIPKISVIPLFTTRKDISITSREISTQRDCMLIYFKSPPNSSDSERPAEYKAIKTSKFWASDFQTYFAKSVIKTSYHVGNPFPCVKISYSLVGRSARYSWSVTPVGPLPGPSLVLLINWSRADLLARCAWFYSQCKTDELILRLP